MKKYLCILLGFLVLLISGCAASYKPSSYQTGQVQQTMKVRLATVVDMRDVDIEARPTGVGASAGAAAGAVVGANPYSGRGGIVTSIAGAVIGGVAGSVAEKAANSKKGIEIVYRLDGANDLLALVQEQDPESLISIGDRVRIMEGSFSARAVKLSAAAAAATAINTLQQQQTADKKAM